MNKAFTLGLVLLVFAGCSTAKINKTPISFIDKELVVKEIKILNPESTTDDRHPVYSPDGSKIAFESYRKGEGIGNIWIMDADGSNRKQLTFNEGGNRDPAFSPDGQKILFNATATAWTPMSLWVMNIDGSDKRKITDDGHYTSAWSPDGKKIAFVSLNGGKSAVWLTKSNNIKPYPLTTGEPYPNYFKDIYQLTTGGNGDMGPVWTPDGSKIIYVSLRDGIREANVSHTPDDLRRREANLGGGYINRGDIWSVSLKDGSYQQLTTDPATDMLPALSPDGSKIAFFTQRNGGDDLWTMNIDGSDQKELIRDISYSPGKLTYNEKIDFYGDKLNYYFLSWSPDGRNIAFTNMKAGEGIGRIGIIVLDILQK